ncbi:MAG TPA: Nif3-like dinuclear metal center hexameric protein [Phycisphaerae bacterium]|jgi:dinuclear metal center YbgI/SA1388 family protein
MHHTLEDVCAALEKIAPLARAQKWDNVGLLAGDRRQIIRGALLCIDLTPAVVDEAIRQHVGLVLAYHPPIFKPISRLIAPSAGTDALVWRCIVHGMAIYSMHTALDAAPGGTNDVIAEACGIQKSRPIEYPIVGADPAAPHSASEHKLVVFVPAEAVERVADAIFTAGAGRIGDYERCSFRLRGEGTFLGSDSTAPVVGKPGRYEHVSEVRLEAVTPARRLPDVIAAIYESHPYEEPAFDIYPLSSKPRHGIGRVGNLPRPMAVAELALNLKAFADARSAQLVGTPQQRVSRAIIAVGAAGSLPFQTGLTDRDVVVTGEIRHHDALAILRHGAAAIALGHWASERPVLPSIARRLSEALAGLTIVFSTADRDPFQSL